jgi:hypothetical protein
MARASYCLWNSRIGPLFGALASRVERLSERLVGLGMVAPYTGLAEPLS